MEGFVLSDEEYVSEEDLSNLILQLIEMGALEVRGYDSISNQFIYNLTPKCQEIMPDLFEEHFKMINELAFKLWSKEIIDLTFDKEGIPMVMPKNIEYTRSIMNDLPDEERFFLENLIQKYENDTKER
jgi:hypothetical protein